jgi:FtsP/CotA-like multicopper oxidase with cupredoxin domain
MRASRCLLDNVVSELLQSNVADGTRKIAKGINGHIPGPPLVVYEGQEVVVTVTNHLDGESTTMHWHGLRQLGTPYMDGAGGVSQCAIDTGHSFTYRSVTVGLREGG